MQTLLLQDWLTLCGRRDTPAVPDPLRAAVVFVPHRDNWLWTGDAAAVVVSVELTKATATETHSATTLPKLLLQTAVSEDGPWVNAYVSTSEPERKRLYLRREAGSGTSTDEGHVAGFLRWAVEEGTGDWEICFRLTAMLEPLR